MSEDNGKIVENDNNNEENKLIVPGTQEITRDDKGRFVKGVCPYKGGGRPKRLKELTEIAQMYTVEAVQTCVEIMLDEKAKNSDRIRASEVVLERGWGKPVQPITGGEDEEGNSKPVTIDFILTLINNKDNR